MPGTWEDALMLEKVAYELILPLTNRLCLPEGCGEDRDQFLGSANLDDLDYSRHIHDRASNGPFDECP